MVLIEHPQRAKLESTVQQMQQGQVFQTSQGMNYLLYQTTTPMSYSSPSVIRNSTLPMGATALPWCQEQASPPSIPRHR